MQRLFECGVHYRQKNVHRIRIAYVLENQTIEKAKQQKRVHQVTLLLPLSSISDRWLSLSVLGSVPTGSGEAEAAFFEAARPAGHLLEEDEV